MEVCAGGSLEDLYVIVIICPGFGRSRKRCCAYRCHARFVLLDTETSPGGSCSFLYNYRGLRYVNDAGKPTFTVQQVSTIMRRVTRAIAYIHSEGIVHRDMKLENVMVKTKNKLDIKICDFGLCARDGHDTQMQTVCGTPTYMGTLILAIRIPVWS